MPGKLSQNEIRCRTNSNSLRIFFGNVYIDAQLSALRNMEEIGFHATSATGVDQVADVRVPRGDNAVDGA